MTEPQDDFAALLDASLQAKRYEKGQTIEGTIVALGADVAFVDVGGKGEAEVDLAELTDADGRVEVAVGDRVQMVVVSTVGGLKLSRRLAKGAASARQLEDAFQAGLAVEGKVEREVKGGYEVRVAHQRAFCPVSQIDIARTVDTAAHVGRVYTFKIVELKDGGRNLVVSRRLVLDEEQRAAADSVRRTIVAGAVLKGRVASVREFGAFVDLGGGIQGLLHVSEMAWGRVADPASVLSVGQEITVKVLRVDDTTQKISLGLKQLSEDPWSTAAATFQVGDIRQGRVTRLTDFGAFVELAPGIEALAHASSFAPTGRPNGWRAEVPIGTTAAFEVLNLDPEKKRIGIALVPEGSTRASTAAAAPAPTPATPAAGRIAPGARLVGKVERHEKFGVFVFLAPGRTALMPLSETGLAREADVAKQFPVGSDVEVVVLDVDASTRRIRVSHKAVVAAQEAAELREYTERAAPPPSGGYGSLADKLRGALERRQK